MRWKASGRQKDNWNRISVDEDKMKEMVYQAYKLWISFRKASYCVFYKFSAMFYP